MLMSWDLDENEEFLDKGKKIMLIFLAHLLKA